MPEQQTVATVTAASPPWVLLGAALLGLLALFGAALDGAVRARESGRPGVPGIATPLVETARLMRQRRRRTLAADVLLWRLGSSGLPVVALLMVAVVPLGRWTLFDSPVGVVWFNAMDVVVWALVWLTGWGANGAQALVGGYRFLAQALGYELPLMFALTAPAIAAGSLRTGDVVAAQGGLWFAVWMPVAFLVYCVGVVEFSVWGPFSVAAGPDLSGGVLSELSGADRLLFLAGRYALLAAGAAFAVPLFLGGGHGPVLPAWLWVLVKAAVLLAVLVLVRRRVPALRPDKAVEAAWVVVLPLVLVQDLVVAVVAVVTAART